MSFMEIYDNVELLLMIFYYDIRELLYFDMRKIY